jgi:uncharacterized protein (TIGR03435 family)
LRTFAKTVGVVALLAMGAAAARIWAQSPTPQPAFDAASVKANKSRDARGAHNNLGQPGGHVAMTDVSLRQLMAQAYNLPSLSQATNTIFGMPSWVDSEHFDIDAEAEGNPTIGQKRLMLQSLLANRFKLMVHHETRQLPVYALVLARPGKPGPQLHPHLDDTACQQFSAGRGGRQPLPAGPGVAPPRSAIDAAILAMQQFPCGRVVGGLLQQNDPNQVWSGGRKVTMETIAESVGADENIDRPVVDRTGLSGSFDFTVEWNHQLQTLSANPQPEVSGLSLFEALRDQLGFKLEQQKGPVDVIVIDHVEQPSEN